MFLTAMSVVPADPVIGPQTGRLADGEQTDIGASWAR
jgi:hypothetical protein